MVHKDFHTKGQIKKEKKEEMAHKSTVQKPYCLVCFFVQFCQITKESLFHRQENAVHGH